MFHDKSNHIKINYHFIRDCFMTMKLQYILANEYIADILTKALMKSKFVMFEDKLGVV